MLHVISESHPVSPAQRQPAPGPRWEASFCQQCQDVCTSGCACSIGALWLNAHWDFDNHRMVGSILKCPAPEVFRSAPTLAVHLHLQHHIYVKALWPPTLGRAPVGPYVPHQTEDFKNRGLIFVSLGPLQCLTHGRCPVNTELNSYSHKDSIPAFPGSVLYAEKCYMLE